MPDQPPPDGPPIGCHFLIDFFDVPPDRLADADLVARALEDAAGRGGLTTLGPARLHRFDGGGVTGFLLLAESHLAIHTYPEFGYAALDLFCCGAGDPEAALAALRGALGPGRERVQRAARGEGLRRKPT